MGESKELFRNNLLTSWFRWLPLKLSVHWLIEGKHRTYQPPRWIGPEWKLRAYWSGSLEKPNDHISVFFHRLELFISTPNSIVKYKNWRRKLNTYKFNRHYDIRCPECNSYKLLPSRGMAYEPIIYCNSCGDIVYEADPEPYII